jgi:hypothetical protein
MEYKLDYDIPAKQKDMNTVMSYQMTNAQMQQPQMPQVTNNADTSTTPLPMTTAGERLNG